MSLVQRHKKRGGASAGDPGSTSSDSTQTFDNVPPQSSYRAGHRITKAEGHVLRILACVILITITVLTIGWCLYKRIKSKSSSSVKTQKGNNNSSSFFNFRTQNKKHWKEISNGEDYNEVEGIEDQFYGNEAFQMNHDLNHSITTLNYDSPMNSQQIKSTFVEDFSNHHDTTIKFTSTDSNNNDQQQHHHHHYLDLKRQNSDYQIKQRSPSLSPSKDF